MTSLSSNYADNCNKGLGEISISKAVQARGDDETGDDGRPSKIRETSSSITNLPGDCLNLIYKCLKTKDDHDSFGLTCHNWLHIQNHNCESLWYRYYPRNITNPKGYILPDISFECFPEVLCKLLTRFPNVKHVSLKWRPEITNFFILQSLFSRSKIQNLCLSYFSKYSDTELSLMFSWFPRLRKISLMSSAITDRGLEALAKCCSSLKSVNLSCCSSITDRGLEALAKCCSALWIVNVSWCKSITDRGLVALAKRCSSLRNVNLSWCKSITDSGISFLLQNCRELDSVNIDFCNNITGIGFLGCAHTLTNVSASMCNLNPEGINAIVSGGELKLLDVGSGYINNEAVFVILKGCPLLTTLVLTSCKEVKLDGWEAIGRDCKNLESLVVLGCANLCDMGLKALGDGCHKLSKLHIDSANSCSSSAVELFESRKPNVIRKHKLPNEFE